MIICLTLIVVITDRRGNNPDFAEVGFTERKVEDYSVGHVLKPRLNEDIKKIQGKNLPLCVKVILIAYSDRRV